MNSVSIPKPLRRATRGVLTTILFAGCGLLAACGGGSSTGFAGVGGGSGSPGGGTGSSGGTGLNTVPVTVDAGPAGVGAVNTLYTTVTVCAPGSATKCQTIDHVQVDTGSTGLRILASALGAGVQPADLPQANDAYGNPVDECVQFADGYSWGAVRSADVTIGSELAMAVPVQVVADPAAGATPASCVQGPQENTVQSFGANAILGVGNFLSDCGIDCATGAIPGTYYDCPSGGACVPVAVPVAAQLQNPVALFPSDNNGVILDLPAVPSPAATVDGSMIFGIDTQSDNAFPASAGLYTLDPYYGTLTTFYYGIGYPSSFIDSGSNGYFFTDDTLTTCADQPAFYCPPSTQSLQASIEGLNGVTANIAFSVDNADTDFATNGAALPDLAGPAGTNLQGSFDWGLPFFYGRPVYVAFEANSAAGVAGPWVGF